MALQTKLASKTSSAPSTPVAKPRGGLAGSKFAEALDEDGPAASTPEAVQGEHDSSSAALASVR